MLKVHILFKPKDNAWGGGNQFLKLLKSEFIKRHCYTDTPADADAIIFNSYHNLFRALRLRAIYPQKIFVHRLGPVFHLHRGEKWRVIDEVIVNISNAIADLTVFQSQWSYNRAVELGFDPLKKKTTIGNSTDAEIFNSNNKAETENRKINLVTDSWSSNWKKGFDFYRFLDENLDFDRYSMTFIGNSPIPFKNIAALLPLPGKELAAELKKNDIFISAVSDDAYSNSIVEALACSLPVVGLDSGGNGEIIKNGGVLFDNQADLLEKIDQVRNNYKNYKNGIQLDSIGEIADKYARSIENRNIGTARNFLFNFKIAALYFRTALAMLRTKI